MPPTVDESQVISTVMSRGPVSPRTQNPEGQKNGANFSQLISVFDYPCVCSSYDHGEQSSKRSSALA